MKPIYAIVLAGDSEDTRVDPGNVVANKAFISINGRRMVDYVLDCFREVAEIEGIGVIGPGKEFAKDKDITVIPQGDSMIDNIRAAAAAFPAGWLLISSSDIPLITPEAIRDLLARCQGADMYYPMVAKEDNQRVFPDMERTWVKLAEGEFTGGNLILIKASRVSQAAGPAAAFFDARKSPVKLASLFGVPAVLKLFLHRLTIPELENKMEKILGFPCKAVQTPYAEIGADVDKKSDYDQIGSRLGDPR